MKSASLPRWILLPLSVLLLATLWNCSGPRSDDLPDYRTKLEKKFTVDVPMRDGVHLATDVYLPEEPAGQRPTLLIRTPYSRAGFPMMMHRAGEFFARYGYAVVIQDVRGRFDSEGEWKPMANEGNDGEDTAAWVVKQPWCNGDLGLLGVSYLSLTAWHLTNRAPEHVKAMVLAVVGTDNYALTYQKGMLKLDTVGSWMLAMHDGDFNLLAPRKLDSAATTWPLSRGDDVTVGDVPFFNEMLEHPGREGRWDFGLTQAPEGARAPIFMISGWYDIFLGSQLDDFSRLGSRDRSRLVVGPWTHLGGLLEDQERDYEGAGTVVPLLREVLSWLDHHLKGMPLEVAGGPVRTWPLGGDAWTDHSQWPPAGVVPQRLYLGSQGAAAACSGGALLPSPGADGKDTFRYDPNDPVPTLGGALLGWVMGAPTTSGGALDQSPLCERQDIRSYALPAGPSPLTLAGPVSVTLHVSSTAEDTSFTAKLVDVAPDGTSFNLQDGIATLAYRASDSAPERTPPGTVAELTIDLAQTHAVIAPGHTLRLDISSSNFPRFNRHPNVFGNAAMIETPVVADQTLYHGQTTPSRLELTVLPSP